MVKHLFTVAFADVVLLAALYFVLQDLAWRSYYAGTPHVPGSPYVASTSYSLLTRFFTMSGTSVSLTSPPTLDWVQILLVVIVAMNAWFGYQLVKARSPSGPEHSLQSGK